MTTELALFALILSFLVFCRGELTSQRRLSDAGSVLGFVSAVILVLDMFVTG